MEHLSRYRPIIDDFEAFLDACRRPLPHTVRVQTCRATVDRVKAALTETSVGWSTIDWDDTLLELEVDTPGRTVPAYLGWVHGQEAASCLPAPVLDPSPGDRIWDACAAPGSKTGHLADLLGDDGLVVATDDNLGRLSSLRFNLERLGVTCAAVDHADARRYDPSALGIDAFDSALVDAPCTGEGTVRKNPSALDEWSIDAVEAVGAVQRNILRRAVELTRPDGCIVYSTCTFAPEENEAVVDAVIGDTDCGLEPFELPIQASPGVTSWDGQVFDDSLALTRRVYPHVSDTGGFYLAKLRVGA